MIDASHAIRRDVSAETPIPLLRPYEALHSATNEKLDFDGEVFVVNRLVFFVRRRQDLEHSAKRFLVLGHGSR